MKRNVSIAIPLVVALLLIVLGTTLPLPNSRAQDSNQVGLVIDFGDGRVETHCIDLAGNEISGLNALLATGREVIYSGQMGFGITICTIGDAGCPVNNCWCQCQGSTCTYWSYWHNKADAWEYSQLGASIYTADPGDVEGWAWGQGQAPPLIPFDQICVPPATDTPTPTWTPTATPTPTPTHTPSPTPEPTDTPLPTHTSTATLVPTATSTPTPTAMPSGTSTMQPTDALAPSATPVPTQTPVPQSQPENPTSTTQPALAEASPTPTLTAADPTALPSDTPAVEEPTIAPEYRAAAPTVAPATVTPTPEESIAATPTPLPVVVARAPTATPPGGARSRIMGGETQASTGLVRAFSIGAGVAYALFGLAVLTLGGVFVFVKLRQG